MMDFESMQYVVGVIGMMSAASVVEKARPKLAKPLDKGLLLAYDVAQVALNLMVFLKLAKVFLFPANTAVEESNDVKPSCDFFGFCTKNSDAIKQAILLHYYNKWLDIGFTALLIMGRRWKKLNFLHIFHHFTIGPVWGYVLRNCESIPVGAYAFGAMVNSFVHLLVFAYFAMVTLTTGNKTMKRMLEYLQLTQCLICAGHACYALQFSQVPTSMSLLQLVYVCNSFILYYRDFFSYGRTVHTQEQDSKTDGVLKKSITEVVDQRSYKERGFVDKCDMLINGVVYDCTSFQERHPGGNIISQYHGTDASDAFRAFHEDSAYAYKVLETLPKSDMKIEPNSEDMGDFYRKIHKKYFSRTREIILYFVWGLAVLGMIYGSLKLTRDYDRPYLAGLIIGVAWAQCGFLQHHAGHVAVFANRSYDFLLQSFFEGLCKGGSARWWRNRHNKHHALPNTIGVDGDLNTTPFFAWDEVLAKKCPSVFLKIQHWSFLPLLALYVPVFFFSTKLYMWRRGHFDELGLVIIHFYAAWSWFGAAEVFPVYNACMMYMIGYAVQGMYLGFFFGLNHFAEERMTDRKMSWPRIQTNTAVNWGCGSWFAAVSSGFLNMQIEHHYFPQCPAFAYVEVQREVEKYCAEKGFRYIDLTFLEATTHMFQGMIDCAKEEIARRREKKDA